MLHLPCTDRENPPGLIEKVSALLKTTVGAGSAFYAGFMPGLAYFSTVSAFLCGSTAKDTAFFCCLLPFFVVPQAIPYRPVDRSSIDEGMDHFIPTDFAVAARDRVLWLPMAGRESDPTVVPLRASNPLVEVGQIRAAVGPSKQRDNTTAQPTHSLFKLVHAHSCIGAPNL